jgi:hypothetical protein
MQQVQDSTGNDLICVEGSASDINIIGICHKRLWTL